MATLDKKAIDLGVGDTVVSPDLLAGDVVRIDYAEQEPLVIVTTQRRLRDPRESRVIENRGSIASDLIVTVEDR